jgi:hypothetical protein
LAIDCRLGALVRVQVGLVDGRATGPEIDRAIGRVREIPATDGLERRRMGDPEIVRDSREIVPDNQVFLKMADRGPRAGVQEHRADDRHRGMIAPRSTEFRPVAATARRSNVIAATLVWAIVRSPGLRLSLRLKRPGLRRSHGRLRSRGLRRSGSPSRRNAKQERRPSP